MPNHLRAHVRDLVQTIHQHDAMTFIQAVIEKSCRQQNTLTHAQLVLQICDQRPGRRFREVSLSLLDEGAKIAQPQEKWE